MTPVIKRVNHHFMRVYRDSQGKRVRDEALIIFAKAPDPGQVKTRLQPFLSKEGAARLQEALILDTLHLTGPLPCTRVLACAPNADHPFFLKCGKGRSLLFIPQEGEGLGERMENAFRWGFDQGFKKVVLIGCDAPTLPVDFVQQAFLRLNSVPSVLGPSLDGGYYLVGARPPISDLFHGIRWGTDAVLTATLQKVNEQKRSCDLLPFWYDIDRPEDLILLKEHLSLLRRQGVSLSRESERVLKSLLLPK